MSYFFATSNVSTIVFLAVVMMYLHLYGPGITAETTLYMQKGSGRYLVARRSLWTCFVIITIKAFHRQSLDKTKISGRIEFCPINCSRIISRADELSLVKIA